jgi:NTE family protein
MTNPNQGPEGGHPRPPHRPRIGLALGSGSARGWAHIGVIRALEQAGIRPDLVCGTSIGALVGAAYAAGELDRFEQCVLGLGVKEVVGLMDVSLGHGLFRGERLVSALRHQWEDRPIEGLPVPFAAVATALHNGEEIWLRRGSTLDAVRASIALPGLFSPVRSDGVVLVDGGLVNPVPVSLARAMGADVVIAIDLGSDILGRHLRTGRRPEDSKGTVGEWLRQLRDEADNDAPPHQALPTLPEVVASSINIMQVRIARSRAAEDPPDVTIVPRLAHLRLLDFHRAGEAIEEGHRAAHRVADALTLLTPHAEV